MSFDFCGGYRAETLKGPSVFLFVSLKLHKSNWLEGWWVSASQRLFWGRMTRGVHHIFAFRFAKSWRYHLDTDSM